MGSASSKAARTLPKSVAKLPPSWAGARAPGLTDALPAGAHESQTQRPPLASETRNEAIERDARDPQLLANLSRLGPVKVDHHMQTVRTTEYVNQAFRSRAQSETEAALTRMPKNRLLAASLADLLEERRFVTTRGELEELAGKYGVDVEKLESVARFVNSPSVDEKDIVRVVESNGDEVVTMMASWKDPVIVNDPNARIASG
ncbi:hypothetical protein HETIRDRAFT_470555 [Heterobasidion irregulare TC 32-1]|uniref:Uncharacterized protein n=1 Tax=Heterobasidion irregulare (strain TC 32-1) TaxID=747525 RepID=W4KJM6_HETIT|nr:uncharacterized protein HETIRDRAFT_470555 [Heterobasidion irregulare TC 32-1]ETW85520.1 hypothetical protein HETIRDRAFT_470555 [Heterobasidion irregulare TC 32-1]